ncbi:MAG: hypothetical protein HQL37_14180 [Alphaproteobacteria bacterium]|nr:hypothetical protein [Alphaproteobacteria bacterium]
MNLSDLLGDAVAIAANPVTGLAKVALDVAPEIVSWFAPETGAAVAKIADAVRGITGTDDPSQAKAALVADPSLAFQLRQQAAAIAHEERMAELNSTAAENAAMLADVASARSQTVELARVGSALAWGAPIVSIIVLLGLVVLSVAIFTVPIPHEQIQPAYMLLQGFMTLATGVVGYWVGSSVSSSQKTALLAMAPSIGYVAPAPAPTAAPTKKR